MSDAALPWKDIFTIGAAFGIDDWAWRRNQRYGTIICDLERRKTIDLLPDRESATAQEWLSAQPQISVVGARRWLSSGSMTREAALLLFSSVHVTVSTISRISFVGAQTRIETK
jgi:hypothetical protein